VIAPHRARKPDRKGLLNPMTQRIFATFGFAGLLILAACGDPGTDRPPLVNSGSYDWQDAFRGPNGYPLPGYEGYFKIPSN
jgi:hypothetical protein